MNTFVTVDTATTTNNFFFKFPVTEKGEKQAANREISPDI
jgi:hypothetical protein